MSSITEKELAQVLVGIAKAQAAIVSAIRESSDFEASQKIMTKVSLKLGGIYGINPARPITLENLPARLAAKALAGSAQQPTLEQLAHQEVGKLLRKS